jgi:hypothetical protein
MVDINLLEGVSKTSVRRFDEALGATDPVIGLAAES